jgi:hypothetical protein
MSLLRAILLRDSTAWRAFPEVVDVEEPVGDHKELLKDYLDWRDQQSQTLHAVGAVPEPTDEENLERDPLLADLV